ncbi:MAG: amidase [Nitrospinota bacterium]
MKELASLDAIAQAQLVRKGEVTARELVESAIQNIEDLNPTLNAVITPTFEIALEAAERRLPRSPLAGVPILLKDLIATCAGVRHTEGSAFLSDHVADQDSELVARIKRAGLNVVGITNTAEFGNASTTEPRLFGPSRNPWDTGRTTGGSSGGSAAAVAAGLAPMAHGNDGGGSVRIPASCCGLFGLKPTRARNPLGPYFGDVYSGLVAEHALTRSVRDSAALLDATSGPATGDPYWAPPPARPFLKEVGVNPKSLRIAFSTQAPSGVDVHPDCMRAVDDAAGICAELGHKVAEAAPSFDGEAAEEAWFMLWAEGNAWLVDHWARRTGRTPVEREFEPVTWALQELGRKRSAAEHLHEVEVLQKAGREIARFFETYDVWLTPTLAQPPVPLGALEPPAGSPLDWVEIDGRFAPFTAIANSTGQPAMSVPLHWNAEGLPVGTHFIGRFGEEAVLFRLAGQLEEARPWAARHAPVSVFQ